MRFTISFIEKDVQLITLIIIVDWSVWLLGTVMVASKFILFSLLRLYYFNLLYGTLSLSWTPLHSYFLTLKRSNVLLWHLIWTANVEPKTGIWCKQKCPVQFLNSPADLDDLHPLQPLSLEETLRTNRWGVGELIAEMPIRTSTLIQTSGLRRKRSTICIFTFVLSSLKDKMHFTCLNRSFTNARERMGNFTPLGHRKIEIYR